MGDVAQVPNVPTGGRLARVSELQPNLWQEACFVTLCGYLLSGLANEFALRIMHGKIYVSAVLLVLLPGVLLITGSAHRGANISFGKWWISFGIWLGICAPFSVWRTDTFYLLLNYYFRNYLLYFVICACVITLRRLRILLYVLGLSNFLIVFICFAFGSSETGRFHIPGSKFSFLSNANGLGLQLLMGVTFLLFVFLRAGKFLKAVSIATIAVSIVYMFKTGSRGVFLAALAVVLTFFWIKRANIKALAVASLICVMALVLLPSVTRKRLTYFAMGEDATAADKTEASALASQMQRKQLFWNSIWMTLQHPIFGVGPGEFMVEDSRESEQEGQRPAWRQTHNSYTQASSEAGIPGFIFYVCSILSCLHLNYRVYKHTAGKKDLQDYAGLSFCMLLCTVGYAVGALFDQLAYTSDLPIIGGVTAATYFAARRALVVLKNQERTTTQPVADQSEWA